MASTQPNTTQHNSTQLNTARNEIMNRKSSSKGGKQRRTGKDKAKNTYKKFGKYTAKSTRIRQAKLEARAAKG